MFVHSFWAATGSSPDMLPEITTGRSSRSRVRELDVPITTIIRSSIEPLVLLLRASVTTWRSDATRHRWTQPVPDASKHLRRPFDQTNTHVPHPQIKR
jgi:hypothetical protein